MVDLTQFDMKSAAAEGADLHLRHPATGEPIFEDAKKTKPLSVRLLGRDAAAVQDALTEANRLHADGKIDEQERGMRVLIASTVGWSAGMEFDGKKLAFTPENARKLFTDPRTDWIAEQAIPFSLSRRNFAQNMKGN